MRKEIKVTIEKIRIKKKKLELKGKELYLFLGFNSNQWIIMLLFQVL
jgi:hypothetical protein